MCGMMTDLILWHAPLSRSTRILWLLEEIGCSYRLETLDSARSLEAALHPTRLPALRDGDVTIHETGAMTEWLCETRAQHLWRTPGASGRLGWLDWLHFAETLVHHVARSVETGATEQVSGALALLNNWLDGSEWLLSEFSGADCQIGYSVWIAAHVAPLDDYPALSAYLARCLERPACKAAWDGTDVRLTVPSRMTA